MTREAERLFKDAADISRALARHYRDPVAATIDRDAAADHEQAKKRGERLDLLADWIAAESCLMNGRPTRADVYNAALKVLADSLYGNQAIDMPKRRV